MLQLRNFSATFFLGAVSLSFQITPTLAQNDTEATNLLSEIVITSSRIETPLRNIGTSVSVIDLEDIRANGSPALIDALRTQPSISVTSNGGAGQISYLRIRGEEGFRTLTLLDGLKIADPSGTQVQPQLEHLLSSGIGRVEILRGPQGLHYGADAGGVINITSISGSQELQGMLDLSAGGNGTQQISTHLSGGNEQADFYISGARFETDGINTRSSDSILRDKDGYENDTLHAKFGVNLTEDLRVDLVLRSVAGDTQYDGCYHNVSGTVHDCESPYEQDAARMSVLYQAPYGSHGLAYSETSTQRDYYSLGELGFASEGELSRLEYIGTITSLQDIEIVYGVDLEENENNGESRDNTGYYLEYLTDFDDQFFVTAGARFDDNDDFGTHTSYRISAAYLVDLADGSAIKYRGSYGTGFRAPSPYEAQYNAGPYASPPASTTALIEETSKGFEAAIEYYGQNELHLEAVYFDQQVQDAIDFDLATYSGYIQESGSSMSKGVELSGQVAITSQLTLLGNYTYNKTERPNGLQRLRRPKNIANVGLRWASLDEKFKLDAFYRRSQDSIDENFGTVLPLDDYNVIDFSATYAVHPTVDLYARLANATDEDYQEIAGYNSLGRSAYLGIRFDF